MHPGNAAMQRMAQVIPGFKKHTIDFSKCEACCMGGGSKKQVGSTTRRARPDDSFRKPKSYTFFGERVASDLCGPFPTSINGDKYLIVFFDCYSKFITVYTLPNKEAETVLDAFKQFLSDHEAHMPHGVKEFWTDNGSEYSNSDMEKF